MKQIYTSPKVEVIVPQIDKFCADESASSTGMFGFSFNTDRIFDSIKD